MNSQGVDYSDIEVGEDEEGSEDGDKVTVPRK